MGAKKAFDSTDPRCIFPKCGSAIDAAMTATGHTNTSLANVLKVDHTITAGYRRGFSRPGTIDLRKRLEKALGIKLDMSEPRPSRRKQPADINRDKTTLPAALTHLAAIALDYGYMASFTPAPA